MLTPAVRFSRTIHPAMLIGLATMLLELCVANRYGIFRDELYYAACGEHLAFGYVDHPPLAAWIAWLSRRVFGASLLGLRLWPSLFAGIAPLMTARLAKLFGGADFAQVLAAGAVALAPEFLGMGHFLSMNCLLPVLWSVMTLFAVRALAFADAGAWLGCGIAVGVGLLAKHSTLIFVAAMALAILISPHRRVLLEAPLWRGVGVALLIFSPNLVWEVVHGWPTAEFLHNIESKKLVHFGLPQFSGAVALDMGPALLPLWGTGFAWFIFGPIRFRFLGHALAIFVGFIVAGHGKPYYIAPAFPILFAAGATTIERGLVCWPRLRGPLLAIVVAGSLPIVPLAIPVLSPARLVEYQHTLGISPPPNEKRAIGLLPQHFADQFGWQSLVTKVANTYLALPPSERPYTTILTDNYGQAGAIDWFGPNFALPHAASGHNSYYLWGPPGLGKSQILIAVTRNSTKLLELYGDVRKVGETQDNPYAMPDANSVPIFVCRTPLRELSAAWPEFRRYL